MTTVPDIRIRTQNNETVRSQGEFVLYWMIANRRTAWNYSLQRAIDWAHDLRKPLVVCEALQVGSRWASDRIHGFVIRGMVDNAQQFQGKTALYYPYLEQQPGAGQGLLAELARRSCVVVSDDFPCFFPSTMLQATGQQAPVRFELVDSNGVLPMRAAKKVYARAYDFRRFLQGTLRAYLEELPDANPLATARLPRLGHLPTELTSRWPPAELEQFMESFKGLAQFPIDHTVPVAILQGGPQAAQQRLQEFIDKRLCDYGLRKEPERDNTSGLSAYLHFGHISAHQVFAETVAREDWQASKLSQKASGSSRGWWGTSEPVELFLDELITWRELGYNMCWQRNDYDQYESLPGWAQRTLAEHESDPRDYLYSMQEFEAGETHDELWNAAQRQLVQEGRIHNYLRMLWGKKILEWTRIPQEALDIMIELNNKYALDGRNPNSYSGIFWVLGRYDRAWGPERPVFGKIRYMSSQNTARKLRVKGYLAKYGR